MPLKKQYAAHAVLLVCSMHGCAAPDDDAPETHDSPAPISGEAGPVRIADPRDFGSEIAKAFPTIEAIDSPPPSNPLSGAELPADEPTSGGREKAVTWRKTAQSNAEIFGWGHTDWDVAMKPAATHICFLTMVRGDLGGGSAVIVHRSTVDTKFAWNTGSAPGGVVDDVGPTWKLSGFQAASNSLSGEATCVPAADFQADAGGVAFYSGIISVTAKTSEFSCNRTRESPLWNNFAVSYLTSVQGDFEGGGEQASIVSHASDPNVVSKIRIQTQNCDDAPFHAHGRSLYVGTASPLQRSMRTVRANASTSATRKVQLIPTRAGVCYLTSVSGNMDGSPESVRITTQMDAWGVENWWLEVTKGDGSAYGQAECIYYDQRRLPTPG